MDLKKFPEKQPNPLLGRRIVSYILDALLLSIILYPLQPEEMKSKTWKELITAATSSEMLASTALFALITIIISLMYWTTLEYKFQQTLGKYLLGMQVTTMEKGKKLFYKQCLLRNISKLSSLLLVLDSIPLIMQQQQRYTERWARTMVVRIHG